MASKYAEKLTVLEKPKKCSTLGFWAVAETLTAVAVYAT